MIKFILLLLISLPALAEKIDYEAIEKLVQLDVSQKLQLSKFESPIKKLLLDVYNTEEGMLPVVASKGGPVVFIHGIGKVEFMYEWALPLKHVFEKNQMSYFYTWSEDSSLLKSAEYFSDELKELFKKHPKQNLTVFAHSTGGVIAIQALKLLKGTEYENRITLHTIATPFYGFKAPLIAYIAVPFTDLATIEMGRGFKKEFTGLDLKNCHHWITTKCDLDENSCLLKDHYPQTGSTKETVDMPCGKTLTNIDDETHTSVVYRVVKNVLK